MLVTMLKQIGGYRNGEAWPAVGGTIDLPDHEAADMIANGYAEEAPDAPHPADNPTPTAADDGSSVADDHGEGPPADTQASEAPPPAEVTTPKPRPRKPKA